MLLRYMSLSHVVLTLSLKLRFTLTTTSPCAQTGGYAHYQTSTSSHCFIGLLAPILSIASSYLQNRKSSSHRRRLPGRAVLDVHLTPPTSSPHGLPSPTPTVTVASTNASSPSSSPSSASVNIRYQASSTS